MATQPAAPAAPASAGRLDWHNIFDSLWDEHDYVVDEVEGTLPETLRGTLYRNGPGINEVGGKPFAHLFDGHGMIHQFALDGQSVRYRNRSVRTHKFLAERDADKPKVRGFGENPGGMARNFMRPPSKGNAANTSVTLHGDNLLALWEGGRPWALDPDSLATRGEFDFDGDLKKLQSFSAHPKYDPRTGEMFNFGAEYFPKAKLRCYRVEGKGGRLHQLGTVDMPFPVMNHDFALTESHMVFVIDPILVRVGRLIAGATGLDGALRWDNTKPSVIVLVPRNGGPARRIETEAFFHFHVNNAFEDGTDTVVDLVRYDDYGIGESLRHFRTGGFDDEGKLWRLRVKPGGEVESHELCPWDGEFPQHDWRRQTLSHRYSYMAGRPGEGNWTRAIIKVDHDTGSYSAHDFGDEHVAGEPIFVARSEDSGEDDGWLLSVVYSIVEHRSRLVVLDARDVEQEPVASAWLKHHVPLGFHGTFTPRVAA